MIEAPGEMVGHTSVLACVGARREAAGRRLEKEREGSLVPRALLEVGGVPGCQIWGQMGSRTRMQGPGAFKLKKMCPLDQ